LGRKSCPSRQPVRPSQQRLLNQATHAANLEQTVFLDLTTIPNLGNLAGALLVFAGQKDNKKGPLSYQKWKVGIIAGLVLGYSSRLAFGCNVGAMVSGVTTGSLHGWIWIVLAFIGSFFGLRIRKRYGY